MGDASEEDWAYPKPLESFRSEVLPANSMEISDGMYGSCLVIRRLKILSSESTKVSRTSTTPTAKLRVVEELRSEEVRVWEKEPLLEPEPTPFSPSAASE